MRRSNGKGIYEMDLATERCAFHRFGTDQSGGLRWVALDSVDWRWVTLDSPSYVVVKEHLLGHYVRQNNIIIR